MGGSGHGKTPLKKGSAISWHVPKGLEDKYRGLIRAKIKNDFAVRDRKTGKFRNISDEEAEKFLDGRMFELKHRRDLERRVTLDEATGLHNQKYFTDQRTRLKRKADNGEIPPFAVVAFDFDRLKEYNDTYDHDRGTKTLVEIAKMFRKAVKKHGGEGEHVLARSGLGDEFSGLIAGPRAMDKAVAIMKEVNDQIRKAREDERDGFEHPGNLGHGRVTVSGGVALYVPKTGDKPYKAADAALYMGKNSGRGCTYIRDPNAKPGENPFRKLE